jgi:hypothetical protein
MLNDYKIAHVRFANNLLNSQIDFSQILFSDESMIRVDLTRKKIWRIRGWQTDLTTIEQSQGVLEEWFGR